jgi:hypothetical protein
MPHTRLRAIRSHYYNAANFGHGIHQGFDSRRGNTIVIYNKYGWFGNFHQAKLTIRNNVVGDNSFDGINNR